jgi:transposase
LGVENTVIEDVEYDETDETDEVVVAHVRPRRAGRGRCGACSARAPWYDQGEGRRRWRGLDLGATRVFLEADARRVNLPGPRTDRAAGALGSARRRAHLRV